MRISSRRRAIAFFVILGVCLVLLAVGLNVGWIILNWREGVLLFLGVIFFALLIAGLLCYGLYYLVPAMLGMTTLHAPALVAQGTDLILPPPRLASCLDTISMANAIQRIVFVHATLRDSVNPGLATSVDLKL